jgi:hypothetical protein
MSRHATAIGVVFLVNALLTSFASAQQPGEPEPDLPALAKLAPAKEDPKDDTLRKLLKERYNAALGELRGRYEGAVRGHGVSFDTMFAPAKRVVDAALALSADAAEQVALLEKYVAFAKDAEKFVQECLDAGVRTYTRADLHEATYFRADAEIQLLRAKEKGKAGKK